MLNYPHQFLTQWHTKEYDELHDILPIFPLKQHDTLYNCSTVALLQSYAEEITELQESNDVYILPYQPTHTLWNYCEANGLTQLFNHPDIVHRFENKIRFWEEFNSYPFIAKSIILQKDKCLFNEIVDTFNIPFVLQTGHTDEIPATGGKSTHFIDNEAEFLDTISTVGNKEHIKITQYISDISFTVYGCMFTEEGVYTPPIMQLMGVKELSSFETSYCGVDWSASKQWNDKLMPMISKIMEKLFKHFSEHSFLGNFSVDFVYDQREESLYAVEINPRVGGNSGMLNYLHHEQNCPHLLDLHVRAFTDDIPDSVEIKKIQTLLLENDLRGANVFINTKYNTTMKIKRTPKPGIYAYDTQGNITFLRYGYMPKQLMNENEFLVYALSAEGLITEPNQKIGRMFFKNTVMGQTPSTLRDPINNVAKNVYNMYVLESI